MADLLELWKLPTAEKIYMIAGWRQWADAGSISSGLPQYLVNLTGAKKIGRIRPDGFYLFQIPGTHHLLRPQIQLENGYRKSMSTQRNEFFYWGNAQTGLVIFLGDEPHLDQDRYAAAFLDAVETLGVNRVAALGGVYGAMPYDKEREISCVYSLPEMKEELSRYAVKFSNYEGGSTIGTFLVDKAEPRGIEFLDLYAFVPTYDFAQLSTVLPGIRIENDVKAWYDVMKRLKHMFGLDLDLTELMQQSDELIASIEDKIEALEQKMPQLKIKEYIQKLAEDFTEMPFMPLDDVWERELGDLFKDLDD